MIRKLTFWDYVFYLSLLTTTIWLILKLTGIINTPLWLEVGLPTGSLIIGLFSIYERIMKEVRDTQKTLHKTIVEVEYLRKDFNSLESLLKSELFLIKTKIGA